MSEPAHDTTTLLDAHRRGAAGATDALVGHACDRLRGLTRRMLRGYPAVGRWEQTDDVLQNALVRLCRALAGATPESPRHFYHLAALQIRRELLDLADRHLGPQGDGANHHSDGAGKAADDPGGPLHAATDEPASVEGWAEFHRRVDALPADERELFGLVWYGGLTQDRAAEVLGVSVRTVKRRWQAARLALAVALADDPPR